MAVDVAYHLPYDDADPTVVVQRIENLSGRWTVRLGRHPGELTLFGTPDQLRVLADTILGGLPAASTAVEVVA